VSLMGHFGHGGVNALQDVRECWTSLGVSANGLQGLNSVGLLVE